MEQDLHQVHAGRASNCWDNRNNGLERGSVGQILPAPASSLELPSLSQGKLTFDARKGLGFDPTIDVP